ncbi:MAG: amino acid adenylation domain-containing protein, partial [Gammaproteobacteria bacterium]|nr:amino acid adenylation domain-containing protein [Gammaproteobacteria bacterium]
MENQQIPLSDAQLRLFLIDELFPNNDAYNANLVFKLEGQLNVTLLEKAFHLLIRRHAILRTTFYRDNTGKCWQHLHQELGFKIKIRNYQNEYDKNIIQEIVKKPFNLNRGPLMRLDVLRESDNECTLVLSFHHIIVDGWSIKILVDELSHIYNHLATGLNTSFPSVSLQYYEHVLLQLKKGEEKFEAGLQYWQQHLKSVPNTHQFPLDKSRPKKTSHKGALYGFQISSQVLTQIKNIARSSKCTLFMFLLTTFNIILYRYTHDEDVIIGSPSANRADSSIYNTVGFFVNLIVFRSTVKSSSTFNDLIKHVRNICFNAYKHQEVPFDKIVDVLKINRDLSYHPVFQIMFDLQNSGDDTCPQFNNIKAQKIQTPDLVSKFDLTLSAHETAHGLDMSFEYADDLFNHSTIVQLAEGFSILIDNIILNPDQPIGLLGILAEETQKKILFEWNNTYEQYNNFETVHERFQNCVEQHSNNVALVCNDLVMTYRQLNNRANQIARYLSAQYAIMPQMLVAVSLEHSPDLIATFFAILKLGCAYVPMDPNYPINRLKMIVEDINPPVLITQTNFQKKFSFYTGVILNLEQESSQIDDYCMDSLNLPVRGNFLAYVIYTSGSTGTPKGVMIEHHSIVERLYWLKKHYPLTENDSMIHHASSSFDVAIEEILWPLTVGSKIVIAPSNSYRDIEELLALVESQRVTVMEFVPSLLSVFLQAAEKHQLEHMRYVFVGGEVLKPETLQLFYSKTGARLFNTYGATEATIDSTFFDCKNYDGEIYCDSIPVGKPRSNTQIYILDDFLNPVPVNVVGEIYIGGPSVARGYLNRPVLNKSKFLQNPFKGKSKKDDQDFCMYKTGDRGCFLPDGNISFCGRIDEQVKLNGHRVELGEIESIISLCKGVSYASVIVKEDMPENQQLFAYVGLCNTTIDGSLKTHMRAIIKSELNATLPAYMIPYFLVFLDIIPLTDNGKLDRGSLPDPTPNDRLNIQDHIPPSTKAEKKLIISWCNTLKIGDIKSVGIKDNFFESGGNSLLAMQFVSNILSDFSIKLPMSFVFEFPTIETLSQKIETVLQQTKTTRMAPTDKIVKTGALSAPLSYFQQQLWTINGISSDKALYNVPAHYYLYGDIDIEKLQFAFNTIIKRHEILKTSIKLEHLMPIQYVMSKPEFVIDCFDLSSFDTKQKNILLNETIKTHTFGTFDFEKDYLIRAAILKMDICEHVLLITFHHIVCDEFSIAIFEKELGFIYRNLLNEVSALLPDLPIQYIDFCIWQRKFLDEKCLQSLKNYWCNQLSGAPEISTFPFDKNRKILQTFKGQTFYSTISEGTNIALNKLAEMNNTTLFTLLLSALSTLLFRYTGQYELVIGVPCSNRTYPELEKIIGYMVNTLPIKSNLSYDMCFEHLLNQVSKTMIDALHYQDMPFEQLVDSLKNTRTLSYNPVFQVMIALENSSSDTMELQDVVVKSFKPKNQVSKFDLTLWVQEGYEGESGLRLGFEYATDLFEASTIERMAQHFER